jgi:hypothetical protein
VSVRPLTIPNNGYRALCDPCPECGQEVRVDLHGDRLGYADRGDCGCDIASHVDEDELRDHLREVGGNAAGSKRPADKLTKLLGLRRVEQRVTGARVVGTGGGATVYLYVTDGRERQELVFERLRDISTPKMLLTELAACTGARPKLEQKHCLDAIALIRELAEHELTTTTDAQSRDWGLTFLQSAQTIDVDFTDQGARWAAFAEQLEPRNPWLTAREEAITVAAASVVLRHLGGTRYVRAEWFRTHVRADNPAVSPEEIRNRMRRVGWTHPGSEGRIKATRPGGLGTGPGELTYAFWVVPPDWEDGCEVTE